MIKQAPCLSQALLAALLEPEWKKRFLLRCASSLTVGLSEEGSDEGHPLINLRRASIRECGQMRATCLLPLAVLAP